MSDSFDKVLQDIQDLHDRKAANYGAGEDGFANLRETGKYGVPPWVGAMIRANDKVARIQTFVQKGNLQNESVEDSLIDLANYAVIALCLYREEYQK